MESNLTSRASIIILNWNGLRNTIDCLESLKKIKYPNYEVIVVDNGSKGNEAGILEEKYKSYIRLIRNKENLGFAEGNNVAIREVIKAKTSNYVLTLNNDITVEPDFLTELIKTARKHPKAGSIQCKMVCARDKRLIDSAGFKFLKPGLVFNIGRFEPVEDYNKEEEVLGCCAGACLYKREALEDIRIDDEYFDKDFFAYCEDVDLAIRLQWMGWESWYCPEAVVYHQIGASSGGPASSFMIFYDRRNHIWMKIKNLPFSFLLKNFPSLLISDIIQIGLDFLRKRPIRIIMAGIKAKFDGYFRLGKMLIKRKKIPKRVNFSKIEKFFISIWNLKTIKEMKRFLEKES